MSDLTKVFDYIEAHKQDYLDELFTLLRCKSISTTNEGVSECAELLADIMRNAGIEHVQVFPTARHPVVYGDLIFDPSYPTQLVYGHYDVQPADPIEAWDSDPFEPVIRDEKIYCRGCSDNKAQLFTYIKGMEAYRKINGEMLPINIKYLFEGEEEIGSENLEQFVIEHKELLKCDAAIYSDGHMHEMGYPILLLGHKGMIQLEMTVTEACKDTHSMRAPSIPSAMWKMVEVLHSLKDETGIVKIEGFYDDVREPTELEKETARKIPVDIEAIKKSYGIDHFVQNREGDNYYYNIVFEPTCNIAGIWGGYTGQGYKTVLPNKATVKMDLRLVPNQDPFDIAEKLKKHIEKQGFKGVEFKLFHGNFPARTPIDNPYVALAAKAVELGFGEKPVLFPSVGGGGPHYIFDRQMHIPVIEIPLARADQNNHAPNESMGLRGFYCGIKMAASLIDILAEKKQ